MCAQNPAFIVGTMGFAVSAGKLGRIPRGRYILADAPHPEHAWMTSMMRTLPFHPLQFVRHEDVLSHSDSKAWLARLVQKYGLKGRSSVLKEVVKYKTSVSGGLVSMGSTVIHGRAVQLSRLHNFQRYGPWALTRI